MNRKIYDAQPAYGRAPGHVYLLGQFLNLSVLESAWLLWQETDSRTDVLFGLAELHKYDRECGKIRSYTEYVVAAEVWTGVVK